MNDKIVSLLYGAARDFVEAIDMEAFKDFGEVANEDTKARLKQLKYAVKVAASYKPKYDKPYEVTFVDDSGAHCSKRCYATEWEAQAAQSHHLAGHNPQAGVRAAFLLDKRNLWK